jgi:hemolysin activation/secretion protein
VVTGVSVFPEDQIQALLASGKGQELTLAEIEGLAARITALYRERGYILARAYVPAQDVRDGTIQIAVVEGRVGKVDIRGLRHYNADFVRRYVEALPPHIVDRPSESPAYSVRELDVGFEWHQRGLRVLHRPITDGAAQQFSPSVAGL